MTAEDRKKTEELLRGTMPNEMVNLILVKNLEKMRQGDVSRTEHDQLIRDALSCETVLRLRGVL